MTKKHYNELARILRNARETDYISATPLQVIDYLENRIVAWLKEDNERFDVLRFYKASGRKN